MEPIKTFRSRTVVMPSTNIDTDQIIPGRFLTTTTKEGLGQQLFADWRYDASGAPKPDFILNKPEAQGCRILVAGRNIGCGSSREHAPWALCDYGFQAVVSTEIADIFRNNSLKNGLLPIVLPESKISRLFDEVKAFPGYRLTVDLPRQIVVLPQGEELPFDIEPFRKYCLTNGFDDIGLTLRQSDKIRAFEAERLARHPWLEGRPLLG